MNPDVLIVGAGPAGMSAALALHESGATVRVIDEQPDCGGQVYRSLRRVNKHRNETLPLYGDSYSAGLELSETFFQSSIRCDYETSVWDISGRNETARIGLANANDAEIVQPRHIILASGAMERPTPFPGWTLPGVMSIGAAQTILKESALAPDGKFVLAGSGPLLYLYAVQLIMAGVKPAMILDSARKVPAINQWMALIKATFADFGAMKTGLKWIRQIQQQGIPHHFGLQEISADGDQKLERITYKINNKTDAINSDLLLVHDGIVPNTHLAMAAGCEHIWHETQCYWAPQLDSSGKSSISYISIVGDAGGIQGAESARINGRHVGYQVASQLGFISEKQTNGLIRKNTGAIKKVARTRQFLDNHYQPLEWFRTPSENQTVICRCEEVNAGEIRQAIELGCMGPNQAKAFTRCGMGPCMGRLCGNVVSQLFAQQTGRPVSDIGYYKIRPPVRPLTVSQLVNLKNS